MLEILILVFLYVSLGLWIFIAIKGVKEAIKHNSLVAYNRKVEKKDDC